MPFFAEEALHRVETYHLSAVHTWAKGFQRITFLHGISVTHADNRHILRLSYKYEYSLLAKCVHIIRISESAVLMSRVFAYLQPLEMEEALAERVLQEVVVPDLDEVNEHGALALALVRYQHSGEKKS